MAVAKTSNSAPALVPAPGNAPSGGKVDPAVATSDQNSLPDELPISTFMSQVSDLIKCVIVVRIVKNELTFEESSHHLGLQHLLSLNLFIIFIYADLLIQETSWNCN